MCIDTTGALDGRCPQRGVPPPPFCPCRESVFTMWAMHKYFFFFKCQLVDKVKRFSKFEKGKVREIKNWI
nr:MAG TPA: hypothetical protein [Caudoviricetes sp.]